MASTVPAKSQPLHNFTLPHLKWNKDGHSGGGGGGGHQRRRSIKSPSRRPNASSASPVRHSPLRDSVWAVTPSRHQSPMRDSPHASPVHGDYVGKQQPSAPGESSAPYPVREWAKRSPIAGDPRLHLPRYDSPLESDVSGKVKGDWVENQRSHSKNLKLDSNRNGVSSTNPERGTQKFEAKSKAKEADAAGTKRSKILIKIPCKNNRTDEENPQEEPPSKIDSKIEADESREEGKLNNNNNCNTDEETKIWNLRPRKPLRRPMNVGGATVRTNGPTMLDKGKGQSNLSNNKSGESGGGQKTGSGEKEKKKLSVFVSLSKEEIEEDIFSLTGSKPARRPKKRPKMIQKQVDTLFPGLWLVSITADSYKVSENSLKG